MRDRQTAPPQATGEHPPTHFVIGQDEQGHWLALETHHLGGGLFKSLADAVRFVGFETGHRSNAFDLATAPLHLTF